MNVGIRELKNRLSHYLRRMQKHGEPIYVTDRGQVIAELRPVKHPESDSERELLTALISTGEVSGGGGKLRDFEPVKPKRAGSVSRIVLEDRR